MTKLVRNWDGYRKKTISLIRSLHTLYSADICLLKVNNGNTRGICETCSKLRIKIPEQKDVN